MQQQDLLPGNGEKNLLSDFDLKEQIISYLIYWKWFLFSVVLMLILTKLYLRYYVPQYGVTSTIFIKDDKKGGAGEFEAFNDLKIFSSKNSVDGEIPILKSRTLSKDVIDELNLDISYFIEGRVVKKELYKDSPIKILFINKKENYYEKDTIFKITNITNENFVISNLLGEKSKKYNFGSRINSSFGDFVILLKTQNTNNLFDNTIIVKKENLENELAIVNSKFSLLNEEKSNVITLNVVDPVSRRGIDYLNTLVKKYNDDAINDRNEISRSTIEFINSRLDVISRELGDVEDQAEQYKIKNVLTDLVTDAQSDVESVANYKKDILTIETQINVGEFMLEEIRKNNSENLIPTDIISSTETSAEYIKRYNDLLLQKRKESKSGKPENPNIKTIDSQLIALRQNIIESLISREEDYNIRKRDLQNQINLLNRKIGKAPTHEKNYNIIARQKGVKEALYLYLLQKREETAITLSIKSPKAKIIDSAYVKGVVSLNKNMFYLGAFLLGLLIPFGIIFLIKLLDTKIKSRNDVVSKVTIPFLGDLPRSESANEIIKTNSRSSSAESIRMIRTNLDFLLASVSEKKCKKIFVTSSIPKEGKTFCSVNLAATFALSDKKTLLVGMDIRNPKLDSYLSLPSKGVTNYISQNENKINDYIVKVEGYNNFYVIPSGVVPPNPSELLMSEKIGLMFQSLEEEFDYIIVDTAPVSVITDTQIIAKYADAFVYVMRANYLDKRMLNYAQALYNDKKLPNMSILLNDTIIKRGYGYGYGYGNGYGYGYGYGEENVKKSFFERLFSIFKKN
jgi:tyrosine-protein kinase Etk/Wzc